MKRSVYIVAGIIFILILLAIWVYVLFFNKPTDTPDNFTDLNFDDTIDFTPPNNLDINPEGSKVDVYGVEKLRQLTTKPIAGYQELTTESNGGMPKVLWIESGTGHVFSINLKNGEEKRVSGTTVPSARKGVISPNGKYYLIQSDYGQAGKFVIGEIGSSTVKLTELESSIVSFKATIDNTFLYAVQTNKSVVLKHYRPTTNKTETIITIPFREVTIDWGDSASDNHFVYPKATSKLEGFLYQIKNQTFSRLPVAGLGLTAQSNSQLTVYSQQSDDGYQSFIYNQTSQISTPLSITLLPEKCVHLHTNPLNLICAKTITTFDKNLPDSWYQGVEVFADYLWEVDTEAEVADLVMNTNTENGRQLDIINLTIDSTDSRVYFTNKNDNTLWLYTHQTQVNN